MQELGNIEQKSDTINMATQNIEQKEPSHDTISIPDSVAPYNGEDMDDIIRVEDDWVRYDQDFIEKFLAEKDESGQDTIQPQEMPQPHHEEHITYSPLTQIRPDSLYMVEVDPSYFLIPDTVYPAHDSAVKYFGEHKLEKQNQEPITKIDTDNQGWAFPFLILSLLFIAFIMFMYYNRLKQIMSASVATRFFNQIEREGNFFNEGITIMLFVNFCLVFSILIYQSVQYFYVESIEFLASPAKTISAIFIITVLFFIIKFVALRFFGWVFKTIPAVLSYYKNIIVFNLIIGLAITPIIFMYVYNPYSVFIYSAWAIFVTANFFKLIRGLIIGYHKTHFPVYYLILYLCAIEFAPLLLIIKFSINYVGIT